ncbi:reverse transcriptase domain-containing protein [Tanacetum coccineum]|uniref:Reverse transcriptase domain-containing protein n=1 Tax=Tanacetum coccineum TaxID=301880 RepID=A0ABQ4XZY7_9ASTR
MLAIFHDMIEESVEVFMDDFSVFRNSFDTCLNSLDKMLQRCKDAHLVLNWEKCHFMVKEGIVLGHKVSSAGLEVDKAKIDIISKLPPPTNIKDTPFEFNDEYQKAFKLLKDKLTYAPVIVSLNWNLPFELMCDASNFAVGAVLGQKDEIKDRKGTENVAADHLSRIENDETSDDSEVDDNFLGKTLMEINTVSEPWFADFANYLVGDIIPKVMTYQQKNKFFSDLKHYFWEEPYLFKVCSDVDVDYVSEWAEAQALPTNDARVVVTFSEETIMPFRNAQSSNQRQRKLDDALWAFRTAYKTPTGTTPYKLIYGKNCHLPFEIEHRAYWALKNCNPDLIAAGEKRIFQLHELDELRHQAYENSRLYKERTKVWHDRKLRMRKEFKQGNKVLLFHSKYKFKQPKLRSRWLGPYIVKHQYPSGYVELYGKDGKTFIVNGHRLKLYHEEDNDPREAVTPFFPN